MNRRALLLLTIGIVLAIATRAWAGGGLHVRVQLKANDSAVAAGALVLAGLVVLSQSGHGGRLEPITRLDTGLVIIDARPPEVQVFLDGRLLGSARQLVARALPVPPGRHAMKIVAPGFRPYRTDFTVDAAFPTRLRIALQPE